MDRVAAARERLETNRAFALQAREAGPACSHCRFRTLLGNCSNPAYAEPRFDAPKGAYEESYLTAVDAARAESGLCGPEALLFEARSELSAVGVRVINSTTGQLGLFLLAAILLDALLR